jgi:hypothetical protein
MFALNKEKTEKKTKKSCLDQLDICRLFLATLPRQFIERYLVRGDG